MTQQTEEWIREVQRITHEWRTETIDDELTPLSQAAHTSVEAAELLDLFVKDETYAEGEWVDVDGWSNVPGGRNEVMEEAGDVIISHLGTLSLLGLDVVECVEAAMEKNGSRDWADHKRERPNARADGGLGGSR